MGKVFNSRKHNRRHHNNKHNKGVNCKPLALAIAVAITGTLPNMAKALEYQVTSTADSGPGSLRQAILDANATTDTPDTIVFDTTQVPAGSTITLTTGEIAVTDTLTITGPNTGDAGSIIIDGNENSRIFNASSFPEDSGKSITLDNLTLQNAKTTLPDDKGGAILIRNANLNLNHSKITNNATEGLTASGGGIFSDALVTLNSSTISGNSTIGNEARAGGIYSENLTVRNSTISGNTTIGTNGSGGGALVYKEARIYNSTVSSNSVSGSAAQGGGLLVGLRTILFSSTIYANTSVTGAAGLSVFMGDGRYVLLTNSILSGNTHTGSGTSPEGNFNDRANLSTAYIVSTNSIFGDDVSEITDTENNTIFNNNPDLGPLLDNGGSVLTHFPNDTSNTSLVINNGNSLIVTSAYDQRGIGFGRIAYGAIDIGAVEVQTTTPYVVTNTNDSGAGSLRQAVIYTNNSSALNTIDLSAFTPNQTITLNSELNITDTVTISGPTIGDAGSLILDGNNSTRLINISSDSDSETVTLENITLQNGRYDSDGDFFNNIGGGAISVNNSDLVLQHSHIINNKTTGGYSKGGGIFVNDGNAVITQSIISGNSTEGKGGGLYIKNGDLTLNQSTVSGNSNKDGGGGGIAFDLGKITFNQSTVSDNTIMGNYNSGGGLSGSDGFVVLNQSTFSGNSTLGASSSGGGLSLISTSITLNQSTVSNNSTMKNGGGFSVGNGGIVTIIQSTISNNSVMNGDSGQGGGIFVTSYGEQIIQLNNSILSNNTNTGNQTNSNINTDLSDYITLNAEHSLLGSDVTAQINGTNNENINNNNPSLGPLQNNGGITFTRAPISGSPVIDKGNNDLATDFTEDQRGTGFDRIINETVDIGAVELQTIEPSFSYDIDDNGQVAALSDGLLVLRYLFGFREGALIAGAIGNSASRTTATEIEAYIQQGVTNSDLDIDGNGEVTALTDGLLLLRYQFGFRGTSLIQGALGNNATRDTAEAIEDFLN